VLLKLEVLLVKVYDVKRPEGIETPRPLRDVYITEHETMPVTLYFYFYAHINSD